MPRVTEYFRFLQLKARHEKPVDRDESDGEWKEEPSDDEYDYLSDDESDGAGTEPSKLTPPPILHTLWHCHILDSK